MSKKNKSKQDKSKEEALPFFKKLLKGIKYSWPFSSAIDVMDLPILQTIHFSNQQIITDEENYDIYLYFRSIRPFYEHLLSYPTPRIYTANNRITFWEYLLYEPYVYVFPKKTLTYKYSEERTFYNRQIAQNTNYKYTVTIDYLMTPLKSRNIVQLMDIDQMCWERKTIETSHIKKKIKRLVDTILGYVDSNPYAIPFKFDDFQGTDISDALFLQLISTLKERKSFSNSLIDQQKISIVPIRSNNHIAGQMRCDNNLPVNIRDTATTFQEVLSAKDDCVFTSYIIEHCYLYLESIKYE